MRISTNALYDNGIARISSIQAKQVSLQNQLSTNKRVNTASDDPIASAQLNEIKHAKSLNAEYTSNRTTVTNSLENVDSILGNISDTITSAKASLVQANSGALSDSDRASIAKQLQSDLDSIMAQANSKDSSGNYIFSGQSVGTQPYASATSAYAGDSTTRKAQVASSQKMALSETANNLFTTTTAGTAPDVFQSLTAAIAALNTPVTSANKATLTAAINTAQTDLTSTQDNVLNARATVGANLNTIDALDTQGSALDTQYDSTISDLEDLDYAKALSDLAKQTTILEAAGKAFTKTTSLSLFTYL